MKYIVAIMTMVFVLATGSTVLASTPLSTDASITVKANVVNLTHEERTALKSMEANNPELVKQFASGSTTRCRTDAWGDLVCTTTEDPSYDGEATWLGLAIGWGLIFLIFAVAG